MPTTAGRTTAARSVSVCAHKRGSQNVPSDQTRSTAGGHDLSRRTMLLVGTTLAVPALGLVSAPAEAKPNIIFILADDLGWKDVGYHGSDIRTPNIDKLAQTGARLE